MSLYSQMLLSALQHVYTKLRERKISDTNLHNEGKFCGGHLQYLEFQLSSEAKAKPEISNVNRPMPVNALDALGEMAFRWI